MLIISIVLVHDKSNAANRNQITILNNNLVLTTSPVLDENGVDTGLTTTRYTINGVALEHECKVYQVVPQGVSIPTNIDLINSRKVYYGNDQPSHNRRFFNWGLKRCIDHGADVVILIKDITLATMADLQAAAQELSATKLLVDRPWGYLLGPKALRIIGQLDESMTFANAITDYKNRIANGGFISG